MTWERLSLDDESMIASYEEHIQRYVFALEHCRGKRVLDAGCGTGYGSHFLAANGAQSVLALDISDEALSEARQNYRLHNLRYERMDVELLGDTPELRGQFDVVVNFENLEHLPHPEKLVTGVASILPAGGTFITSTPNGAISDLDENGKLLNAFHVKEFTKEEFESLVSLHFKQIAIYGQWLTHGGKLRKLRSRELFEQLCETYFNPMNRLGRLIKRIAGKKVAGPPRLTAGQDFFVGDNVILPLELEPFRWPPGVLIAVCKTKE
jgi:2-polyprenyl-3-methyl-5-hydroxy-6-metoxy-1,4-benzoquinol methylase